MTGKELLKLARKQGFELIRIKGSHHIMIHSDGRELNIPIHSNIDIPKGLLHTLLKIINKK